MNFDPSSADMNAPASSTRRRRSLPAEVMLMDESLHRGSPKYNHHHHPNRSPSSMDSSLRTQRSIENAPTNRVKHLLLTKRRDVYKRHTADTAQVTDGRSVEGMRRNSSEGNLPWCLGERKPSSSWLAKQLTPRRERSDEKSKKAASWHGGPSQEEERERRMQEAFHHYRPVRGGTESKQQQRKQRRDHKNEHRRPSVESADSLSSLFEDESVAIASNGLGDSTDTLNSGFSNDGHVKNHAVPKTIAKPNLGLFRSDPTLLSNSNHSMTSNPESRLQLRKKYQPRHRCPNINGSVTGIVKPSRYSRSNSSQDTAATAASSAASAASSAESSAIGTKPKRYRRRATLPSSIGRPELSSSFTQLQPGSLRRLSDSHHEEGSFSENDDASNHSRHLNVSNHSSASWVPHGVDFSASMEVYVFHE